MLMAVGWSAHVVLHPTVFTQLSRFPAHGCFRGSGRSSCVAVGKGWMVRCRPGAVSEWSWRELARDEWHWMPGALDMCVRRAILL